MVTAANISNLSLNSSSPLKDESGWSERLEFKITKICFYFLILACSTTGNTLVVYIIASSRRMRSASHLLVLNLAVCDLLTPLVSIPFDFALEENGYRWLYGELLCKILGPCATLAATSSALTLAAISLDRYRSIMHPFQPKLTRKTVLRIVTCIHVFSTLVIIPYVVALQVKGTSCEEKWSSFKHRQIYTAVLFLAQYCLPLVFMVLMYTLALTNLYQASKNMRRASSTVRPPNNENRKKGNDTLSPVLTDNKFTSVSQKHSIGRPEEGNQNSAKDRKRSRTNKARAKARFNHNARATKMFIIVVSVFAVFMFPNQFLWLWSDFGKGYTNPLFRPAAIICWLFTYTNSVCNPIIYYVFGRDLRVEYKRLYAKLCCRTADRYDPGDAFTNSLRSSFRSTLRRLSLTERKPSNISGDAPRKASSVSHHVHKTSIRDDKNICNKKERKLSFIDRNSSVCLEVKRKLGVYTAQDQLHINGIAVADKDGNTFQLKYKSGR